MKKEILLFLAVLFVPKFAFSYSSFPHSIEYLLLYFLTVLPVLLWIFNVVIYKKTKQQKEVKAGVFWLINSLSICLALLSFWPVCEDLANYRHNRFSDYIFTLTLCVVAPMWISAEAIYQRKRLSKLKNDTNEL